MDNAATTRVTQPVLDVMLPCLTESFGNAMSPHSYGREARLIVENARSQVAKALGADPSEIFFTSCGTESDNWALRGAAYGYRKKGKHIITSTIEHHAVLHTCEQLEKEGFEVSYIPVDKDGILNMDALRSAIRPDTILISIMTANNEIGTLQPIEEVAVLAHEKGVLFHTDAVQAIGSVKFDVKEMGIDMLSISGHKFHAPKGVGVLYVRKGVHLQRLIYGGAQERTQRAGTENVASIAAIGRAIEIATENIDAHNEYLSRIRDRLIDRILAEIPYTRLNGHRTQRLPNNCNISFRFIEGESLLLSLDILGVSASSGSACTSSSLDPSHVLLAIGLPHEIAHGSLRLSLSEENTMEQADFVVDSLKEIVERLRALSPLYAEFKRGERALDEFDE